VRHVLADRGKSGVRLFPRNFFTEADARVLAVAALLFRRDPRAAVKKLRNGGEKLGDRKRLSDHNALWQPMRCPFIGTMGCYINDRDIGIGLASVLRDVPAAYSWT
jgi:hypothetical protein